MNRKGFTLVELIATLVILGIVIGITLVSVSGIFSNAKNKTEDVFVETIKDAMEIYLSSDARSLDFSQSCTNFLKKSNGNKKVDKVNISFRDVINSKFKPLTYADLVNPANEDVNCAGASSIPITIYKDSDYVYYYSIEKDNFGCLLNNGVISNLPEGYVCD